MGTNDLMVAALFVDRNGCYADAPDVDLWPEDRDARLYAGPYPVVAHPPCSRWCRLAGLVEARWGHKRGEDDGCFESALRSVRRWGGLLEHPAWSDAWSVFGLPVPPTAGGWQRGLCGGWSAYVEQGLYGHPAKKATWLYAMVGSPPPLRWGRVPDPETKAWVSCCGNRTRGQIRPRIRTRLAAATPPEFRDQLLSVRLSGESKCR